MYPHNFYIIERGSFAMYVYVKDENTGYIYQRTMESFMNDWSPELHEIKENLEMDVDESIIEKLFDSEHIKDTFNDKAKFLNIKWEIMLVSDVDYEDLAEHKYDDNKDDMINLIFRRMVAIEADDSFHDREDDELTNFVLENF